MVLANGTDIETIGRRPAEQFTIAIVGGGLQAASLLRVLSNSDRVTIAALCASGASTPAFRLAEELRIFTTPDLTEVFQVPGLDLIIDLSEHSDLREQLRRERPQGVELLGAKGSELLREMLQAQQESEEHARLYVELQVAYDKIRSHERRLEAGKDALEATNAELERRLAEIFFTHEYVKALASYINITDVCALIVDGCIGIVGVECSAVYLFERSDWTLRLKAHQGPEAIALRDSVPVSETILGAAFRSGTVQEADAEFPGPSTAWVVGECPVRSQVAMALATGDEVMGVVVVASTEPRELDAVELERLSVVVDQSSLSLQNALLHAKLERLSVTDRLTDLYNHGHLKQRLDEEFKRAARFGHPMSLIMLDIDDFKAFNDTFGHPRGDMLLKAVSDVIRDNLRSMDIAARYGGEEFVVVLPETDIDGAVAVAERIREGVEELRLDGPQSAPVLKTISAGVATFPQHAVSALRLLEAADSAMYAAKRAGKNRVASAVS